jgi:hypothetical protein
MRLSKFLLTAIVVSILGAVVILLLQDRNVTNLPRTPFVGCLPPTSPSLSNSFSIETLEDARNFSKDFPSKNLDAGPIWLKETANFEIRITNLNESIGPMNEGYCNYDFLEMRIKPDGTWKKLAYHAQYSDSAPQPSEFEQITVFNDSEVGVWWFNEGYYLSLDTGKTWSYWNLEEIIWEESYYAIWNISETGEGSVQVTIVERDREKGYRVDKKRYTFETTDKGTTWQLTKEEALIEN